MARHDFKAFVGGDEFIVEDHLHNVTIRNAYTGNRILDVHKDTAAELVAILEYMGLTLKNNDLSIEKVERMQLEYNELKEIIKKDAREFVDGKAFETLSEAEKDTLKQLMNAFVVKLALDITNAEMDALDRMAEVEQ